MARTGGRSWKKALLWLMGIAVVLFVVIQFIPYGRSSHANPPATNAFNWTNPQAAAIARNSCYDCHSNETKWWWATNIAPFSWLVQHDVDEGRSRLNFSQFDGFPPASRFAEIVNGGKMPPPQYALIHPSAKLSDAQTKALNDAYAAGLLADSASNGGLPQSSPSPSAGAAAGAVAIINQRCSICHPSDPALNFRAGGAAEAQALIDQMKQLGAQLTPQEEQLLIAYFTR